MTYYCLLLSVFYSIYDHLCLTWPLSEARAPGDAAGSLLSAGGGRRGVAHHGDGEPQAHEGHVPRERHHRRGLPGGLAGAGDPPGQAFGAGCGGEGGFGGGGVGAARALESSRAGR